MLWAGKGFCCSGSYFVAVHCIGFQQQQYHSLTCMSLGLTKQTRRSFMLHCSEVMFLLPEMWQLILHNCCILSACRWHRITCIGICKRDRHICLPHWLRLCRRLETSMKQFPWMDVMQTAGFLCIWVIDENRDVMFRCEFWQQPLDAAQSKSPYWLHSR